jgi:hypothetical protein
VGPGFRRAVGWVLGLGLLVLAGVVGATLLLRASITSDGTDAGADTGAGGVPPITAGVPASGATPVPVPADRMAVVASSSLAPDGDITYEPSNTIDDDLDTAWNSDSPEDDGRGQTLTYRFTEPVAISSIQFVNGYAKNEGVFAANHRIREILVHTDAGSQLVTLLDTTARQEIEFDFGFTSKVILEVQEIYPGDGFTDPALTADLALTEVAFLAVLR